MRSDNVPGFYFYLTLIRQVLKVDAQGPCIPRSFIHFNSSSFTYDTWMFYRDIHNSIIKDVNSTQTWFTTLPVKSVWSVWSAACCKYQNYMYVIFGWWLLLKVYCLMRCIVASFSDTVERHIKTTLLVRPPLCYVCSINIIEGWYIIDISILSCLWFTMYDGWSLWCMLDKDYDGWWIKLMIDDGWSLCCMMDKVYDIWCIMFMIDDVSAIRIMIYDG